MFELDSGNEKSMAINQGELSLVSRKFLASLEMESSSETTS
jgi:hypothetical protein